MGDPAWPKILLVDDDPAHSLIARRAISRAFPGAQIIESTNIKDSLDKVASGSSINLAIIDFNLGIECGADLVEQIRKRSPLHELPIIVISTSDLTNDAETSYRAGASCFIVKEHDAGQYQLALTDALNFFLNSQ